MNDFLTKPIDAQRLQQALLRWVGSRRGSPLPQPADPPA
jgi:response regulator of citrate/malate metabolism